MNSTAIDSRIFRNLFGTEDARQIFSDTAYVSQMIAVEAALARAEAKAGVVPKEAAVAITEGCKTDKIDFDKLATDTDIVGYPVFPLVEQMNKMIPQEHAKYIHWGATTQDIMDCASMYQMKEALQLVRRQLLEVIRVLEILVQNHRDTPMAGRTHLQHALPVTFGYKAAVYLSGFQRHYERLQEIEQRCLLVQFGGAAGTLASLGSDTTGLEVRRLLAEELGLKDPSITWHVARDHVAEIVSFLGLVGGSLGKIALDIIIMSSNELGEVSEPFVPHRGASSTMPQKRNPISSEVILAASKLLRANAGLAMDAMVSDFERASGPWHLEWVCIPESFIYCCGALHQTAFALGGLVVNADAMKENLASSRGLILAEAVMMGLAPTLGRQPAHDVVYRACHDSIDTSRPLIDSLLSDKAVVDNISKGELMKLCDPLNYMGCCRRMADQVLQWKASVAGGWNGTGLDGQTNGVH
ncbi:hypothetical protein PRZ48_002378 [Zasmidium cellare]|uniref:Adenylosuccinate lyase C-terminal domain-containing protein n=1 Tax=Zasmidium cellare TaxID=395010 RepID=A0ABR0F3V2_ZASCE|nr:hypothetical protein PRZ48_002378 [Zasmidium cellare]